MLDDLVEGLRQNIFLKIQSREQRKSLGVNVSIIFKVNAPTNYKKIQLLLNKYLASLFWNNQKTNTKIKQTNCILHSTVWKWEITNTTKIPLVILFA